MMTIYKKQNTKEKLQFLAAYSTLYSNAKKIMGIRTSISIIVTISGTLVALLIPSFQLIVGSVSAIWALISEMILKPLEKQKVKEGATIQEEFDTSIFNLSWNQGLVGNKVTPELVISADRNFKGNRSKLQNWYPNTGKAQRPLDILLCQRSCVVWDWRLRKTYIGFVLGGAIILLIGEFIIGFILNMSIFNFFLSLFLPSSSLYLIAYEVFKDNYDLLGLRQKLDEKIAKLIPQGKRNIKSIGIKVCRDIQDDLYRLRSKGALIPNWFYWFYRENFESDMQKATKTLISNK